MKLRATINLLAVKIGHNVQSDTDEDRLKSGIIDPAKVTRIAVENSNSIAAMILTPDGLITDVPEKNPAPSMPYGGDGYKWGEEKGSGLQPW